MKVIQIYQKKSQKIIFGPKIPPKCPSVKSVKKCQTVCMNPVSEHEQYFTPPRGPAGEALVYVDIFTS